MSARREVGVAVLLCLAGSALVLLAAGRPWAHALVHQPPLPPVQVAPTGRALAPVLPALGLVGLAGVAALAATRRWGRIVAGVLLLGIGGAVLAVTLRTGADLGTRVRPIAVQAAGSSGARPGAVTGTGWGAVSGVGSGLLAAAGLLVVGRGRRWATMSARYDAPTAPRPRVEPATALWDALDRGDDPTR